MQCCVVIPEASPRKCFSALLIDFSSFQGVGRMHSSWMSEDGNDTVRYLFNVLWYLVTDVPLSWTAITIKSRNVAVTVLTWVVKHAVFQLQQKGWTWNDSYHLHAPFLLGDWSDVFPDCLSSSKQPKRWSKWVKSVVDSAVNTGLVQPCKMKFIWC